MKKMMRENVGPNFASTGQFSWKALDQNILKNSSSRLQKFLKHVLICNYAKLCPNLQISLIK